MGARFILLVYKHVRLQQRNLCLYPYTSWSHPGFERFVKRRSGPKHWKSLGFRKKTYKLPQPYLLDSNSTT